MTMFDSLLPTFGTDFWNLNMGVAEKLIRSVAIYVFLVVALRIFGKRELAQLNPFDLVVLLTLSNTVQNALIGNETSLLGGMLGATALLGANYVMVRVLYRHRKAARWLAGKPVELMRAGRIHEKAMAAELLSRDDLTAAAHRQGFRDLHEISDCSIETSGLFTFQKKRTDGDEAVLAALARIEALLAKERR
ncbi:MAG: DUF421 domain-containing protein [Acidobacteria bacterium]|nr:DUF421 domain-containing protein [Acidobacteriota bacterium]